MEIVQQDDGNTALSALTNTHLVEILNSANLKDSLPLAENFILSRIGFARTIAEKFSTDISLVWDKLRERGKASPLILDAFESQLEAKSNGTYGQSFKQWRTLGDAHRSQSNNYRIQVLENWGCEPYCLLSAEMYPPDKPLSKALIKQMAELSNLVSVDEGRELLISEIHLRSQGGRRYGKLSYQKNLILSVLTEAIDKASSKTPIKRLLDSAPDQTSDETSDQTQQDRSHKKRSLGLQSSVDRVMGQAVGFWQADHLPSRLATNAHRYETESIPDQYWSTAPPVSTLEPEGWLSSEVIFRVLRACAPTNCFVVDPLFLDLTSKSSSIGRVRKPMPKGISTVIVPLHHNNQSHWTVVTFRRERNSARHLDSFPSLKSTLDDHYFHQCMKELDKEYEDKDILVGQCPVQANEYDCGVQVLANALYVMGGRMEAPLAHDCGLWRRICRAIITHNVDECPEKPLDISAELMWRDIGPGRHQAVEEGFDRLQSKLKRNRSEVEEVLRIGQLLENLLKSSNDTQSRFEAEIRNTHESRDSLRNISSAILGNTLMKLESDLKKSERRLKETRDSALGLKAARDTLDGAHARFTQQWELLKVEQRKWEEGAKSWQKKIEAEADWTRSIRERTREM